MHPDSGPSVDSRFHRNVEFGSHLPTGYSTPIPALELHFRDRYLNMNIKPSTRTFELVSKVLVSHLRASARLFGILPTIVKVRTQTAIGAASGAVLQAAISLDTSDLPSKGPGLYVRQFFIRIG
jgi:hypothetical protein